MFNLSATQVQAGKIHLFVGKKSIDFPAVCVVGMCSTAESVLLSVCLLFVQAASSLFGFAIAVYFPFLSCAPTPNTQKHVINAAAVELCFSTCVLLFCVHLPCSINS